MQPTPSLAIKSPSDLVSAFRELGTKVGLRTGPYRRTKDQKEWYCLRRYLLRLGEYGLLNYPIEIKKAEPPDFIVVDPVRGSYGIEISEATEEGWQRDLTLTERDQADPECHPKMRAVDSDDGWVGQTPEKLWRNSVLRAISRKLKSVTRPNYPVACCDILVWEESQSGIVVHRRREMERLRIVVPGVAELARATKHLGTISVLSGDHVLHDLLGAFHLT